MRIKTLTIALSIILLAACKKDNKPTVIQVNAKVGNQAVTTGVPVLLLSDDQRTTASYVSSGNTDNAGKIDFNVTANKVYYIYCVSNTLANTDATYIITGKFTSQQQIDSSPAQTPAAQVGGDIEMDINGDGVINNSDKVIKVIAPKGNTTTVNLNLNINNL
jgi:hypothetical protein